MRVVLINILVLQLGPQTKILGSAPASDNVSVISGNVLVKHGRPMRAFKFELSLAVSALRVCKPEDGRRVVTCLGTTEIKWPKDISGGPEISELIGGLVKA